MIVRSSDEYHRIKVQRAKRIEPLTLVLLKIQLRTTPLSLLLAIASLSAPGHIVCSHASVMMSCLWSTFTSDGYTPWTSTVHKIGVLRFELDFRFSGILRLFFTMQVKVGDRLPTKVTTS